MPDCKHYAGINRAELNELRKDLAKEGVTVPEGDDVEISGPFGILLRAIYDERGETLKICLTEKPFYIPEFKVWELVDRAAAPYVG